ncbi:hypothetical protein [Herbaspirillum sp. CF444]|uniref:hypothetical protein n=1 Tax=Herbaspirillum sp. CF444 TaxID=1144319 RepID=UPI0012F7441E|nr:hypothetical protein [Herbaspirillum sp. CF444]
MGKSAMKRDLQLLYAVGFAFSLLTFLISLGKGAPIYSHDVSVLSALDISVATGLGVIITFSLGALLINNFIYARQKKNWRDFWSKDMLEYFYGSVITETWRIARGRMMLFLATFFVTWLLGIFCVFLRTL